jgi:signal transduction histidine kinase
MLVLSEASEILSTPQGSLVYYLLLLWAVAAGLAMAWGEWRRARRERAKRLLLAMVGLTLVRVAYALAALATSLGWITQAALLPPMERFADTISIGLLAWMFMPPAKRGVRAWDLTFGINLVLALGACVGFIVFWNEALTSNASLNYNASWQATVWAAWQVALIVLATLAVVRSREKGWGTFLPAMFVMFLGRLLQWLDPGVVPHLPLWERLANLVAYPLLAIAIYQGIVAGLRVHSRQLQDISQASLDQIKSLIFLFEAGQQTSSSLDLSTVLDNSVSGIARALDADQCAIAFPEEGNGGQMRLVAIYNPARQGRGEVVAFPLEYQLTVQQAMRRKKYVIVEELDNVQLQVLFALLGSGETGPLLVQPLVSGGQAIGAIIVGNSRSRRPFTPNEAKLCQSMADQAVTAIQNAWRYQAARRQIKDLNQALDGGRHAIQEAKAQNQKLTEQLASAQKGMEDFRRREEAAREARNALEIKLVSSRAEVDSVSQRVAVLETDLGQALASAEAQRRWHEEELARRQAEWQESIEAAEQVLVVLHGMTAGILITDDQGLIRETNVAAEILLDRGSDELQNLDLKTISDDERWQQAITTASGGEAGRLTMQIGMNTLMCDVAPLPIPDTPQGEVKGLIVILQDISTEIEEQRSQLDGMATLTEELRTPLTTIISYADLLLSEAVGIVGSAQRKFLLRIKAGAERMVQMANDLTKEAGGEERWTSPQRKTVDVNKLIEATLARSHVQLEDRALTLDLDLPDDLPPVKGDPDYLRRVLSSLLSNAFLASSVGGRIQVCTAKSLGSPFDREGLDVNGNGFVVVSVKDSGGGLSDEALSRIFDRARPSQTPQGLGESGASLALVKMLVEAHGGRLWVESESGVGTTISCVLPANDRWERLGPLDGDSAE